jgi:hypothetical protein
MRKASLVVMAALAAACSSGGGDDPPPPTTGSLQLVNGTTSVIHQLYVAKSTETSWGAQRNSSPIASGGSFTVSGLDPVLWDLKAVSIGTYSQYYAYGQDLAVNVGETNSVTAYNYNFSGTLKVYNDDFFYQYPIVNLYISPTTSAYWSDDLLYGVELPYAYYLEVVGVAPGGWDVWCKFSNGTDEYGTVTVSSFGVTNVSCNGY